MAILDTPVTNIHNRFRPGFENIRNRHTMSTDNETVSSFMCHIIFNQFALFVCVFYRKKAIL